MEKLLKKEEVAEMFGITVQGLNKWIRERKIPYVKLPGGPNGSVRFKPEALQVFVSNRTVSAKQTSGTAKL
jgi:excisionase family DNA binding protein